MGKVIPFKYHAPGLVPINDNDWFHGHQRLLLKMAKTGEGRDLLCIDKLFDHIPIIGIGKNYVRGDLGGGQFISDFRVGDNWARDIRHRWPDFSKYAKQFYTNRKWGLNFVNLKEQVLWAATTSTFYPDPHSEIKTFDGYVFHALSGQPWDTVHDAATGTGSVDSGTFVDAVTRRLSTGAHYQIEREIDLYDLSSLSGQVVTSGDKDIYPTIKVNDDNDGNDFYSVLSSNPASNTGIVDADYDQVGDTIDNPTELSVRLDLGVININAYNSFALNVTGVTFMNAAITGPSKIAKLGMRSGHDQLDIPVDFQYDFLRWNSSEAASNRQRLVLVHEDAPSAPGRRRRILLQKAV